MRVTVLGIEYVLFVFLFAYNSNVVLSLLNNTLSRVWKNEFLSDNGQYIFYKSEFQYYPDEIKKNDTQAFENYLIKLTAWLKQLRLDTKLQLIQKDF